MVRAWINAVAESNTITRIQLLCENIPSTLTYEDIQYAQKCLGTNILVPIDSNTLLLQSALKNIALSKTSSMLNENAMDSQFKHQYVDILTTCFADELDELRQSESFNHDQMELLVDFLKNGLSCEHYTNSERQLLK